MTEISKRLLEPYQGSYNVHRGGESTRTFPFFLFDKEFNAKMIGRQLDVGK